MNATSDEHLVRLREADPARDVHVTPHEAQRAADTALELAEHGPRERSMTVPPRHRRVPRVAAAAGAIALVAVIAVSLTLLNRPGTLGHSGDSGGQRSHAQALVDRLVASLALPADAVAQPTAPDAALKDAPAHPLGGQYVSATRWYTAGESPAVVVQFIRTHSHLASSGSDTGRTGGVAVSGLRFSSPATSFAEQPQILVAVVQHDGGSALRIDAQAVWLDKRDGPPLPTYLPVEVTVERVGTQPVDARLTGSAAQKISSHINALPLAPNVDSSCGDYTAGDQDTLVVGTAHGKFTVQIAAAGCPSVRMTNASGNSEQLYDPNQTTNSLILRLLGLPANYGRR